MPTKTETLGAYAFVKSLAPGDQSLEQITILSGSGALIAGTVLGKVTKTGAATSAPFAGNTGNGVMGAVTVGANALPGDYKLVIVEPNTNLGTFTVEGPDGKFVGRGNVGTAFATGGLSFTLADGATDFVSGDGFTITVTAGSGKYKPYDNDATDGSEVAAAILVADADATSADVAALGVVRLAEIWRDRLVWGAGVTTQAEKDAAYVDFAAANIAVRF